MVVAGEGWHQGVLGIVAARLMEAFYRPVALVSLENGLGRGSARSIEGFHLYEGLYVCRHHLLKFGGHAAAAGFVVADCDLEALQIGLEAAFQRQLGDMVPRPTLNVDAEVNLAELNGEFFSHLELLRPFGPGNPEPVFVARQVRCLGTRVINDRHLKLQLAQQECVQEAILFDGVGSSLKTGPLEVAFTPRITYVQGVLVPEFRLLDWDRQP
jgi:single-stranded-DNA-specific exonuclease